MKTLLKTFENLALLTRDWVAYAPHPDRPVADPQVPAEFFETSDELIDRIVQAIALNQSVLLYGPRGCGKSYCVREAIKRASGPKLKILQRGASVFIQGNKELPRDYLCEDEVTFRLLGKEVVPMMRSAPIFRFAERNDKNEPKPTDEWEEKNRRGKFLGDDHLSIPVKCKIDIKNDNGVVVGTEPLNKFVLFLDEINRFSDGVLDSLLLLMEEGESVLAGETYKLPVVVCMTMNPPGYDASARTLSPPLAARIGQAYRLRSPSINTLTDVILPSTVSRLVDQGRHSCPTLEPPNWGLLRRAALVTLCCWGDPDANKAGLEYLTDETRELLRNAKKADHRRLEPAMKVLTENCSYGPDARALLDWVKAAVGVARAEAIAHGTSTAVLKERHLVETARRSIAHKIHDEFSQASRPDLTRAKEEAIRTLAERILSGAFVFDKLVVRNPLDYPERFHETATELGIAKEDLRGAFAAAGIGTEMGKEGEATALLDAAKQAAGTSTLDELIGMLEKRGIVGMSGHLNSLMAFKSKPYSRFALKLAELLDRKVAELGGQGAAGDSLKKRASLWKELVEKARQDVLLEEYFKNRLFADGRLPIEKVVNALEPLDGNYHAIEHVCDTFNQIWVVITTDNNDVGADYLFALSPEEKDALGRMLSSCAALDSDHEAGLLEMAEKLSNAK